LLHQVFGKEWINQKILTLKARMLLQDQNQDFRGEAKLMNLIQMLGEGLFNLRCVKVFENILEKMATDNIDAALAEIESGRLLKHQGIQFNFVKRTGIKRQDYDIQISDRGAEICCKTKFKTEGTKFSSKLFEDNLSQGKKQLPLDKPSLLLIKVPTEWTDNEPEVIRSARKIVDKTKRPFGIVCWRESWDTRNGDVELKYITGFESHNELGLQHFRPVLPFLPKNVRDKNWTDFAMFSDFVGRLHRI
jgi:hypothetical protein